MAAQAPRAAATNSARGDRSSRLTSSRGGGRGEYYALRDHGVCHFEANCIFEHPVTKKHRPNCEHGGGGGQGGVNSTGNGGGGGRPSGRRAKDGCSEPATAPVLLAAALGGESQGKAVRLFRRPLLGVDRGQRWNQRQEQRLEKARADLCTGILTSGTS